MEAEEKVAADTSEAMAKSAEAAERLKTELAANMKEKGDAFDSIIESEDKIRLGEEGWKARYYQVPTRVRLPPADLPGLRDSCTLRFGRAWWLILIATLPLKGQLATQLTEQQLTKA